MFNEFLFFLNWVIIHVNMKTELSDMLLNDDKKVDYVIVELLWLSSTPKGRRMGHNVSSKPACGKSCCEKFWYFARLSLVFFQKCVSIANEALLNFALNIKTSLNFTPLI